MKHHTENAVTLKASRKYARKKARYDFFMSPYRDQAFTRCPKCDGKTKVRMFPLVIHIDPMTLLTLNKSCKLCPYCDLIIVRKDQFEQVLTNVAMVHFPEVIGNRYLVMGTLDRKLHRTGVKGNGLMTGQLLEEFVPFKNHLLFEIRRGWMPGAA